MIGEQLDPDWLECHQCGGGIDLRDADSVWLHQHRRFGVGTLRRRLRMFFRRRSVRSWLLDAATVAAGAGIVCLGMRWSPWWLALASAFLVLRPLRIAMHRRLGA